MSETVIVIPDIGDAEDVEVIEICIAVGEAVAENDPLIVIESDKASMEVPAVIAGTVAEVLVALGDHVNSGDAIMRLETATESMDGEPTEAEPTEKPGTAEPVAPVPVAEPPSAPPPPPQAVDGAGSKVYAGPAVRRLARELGVDLTAVAGTGVSGRIIKDDVKGFVKGALTAPAGTGLARMPEIDFSRFGDTETVPLSRIRVRGARNLARSWQHVVHVTQHDDADVTDLEAFRASLKDEAATAGVKLTPLPFIVMACVHVLKRHPEFNASLDPAFGSLILKRYYNIGMAVDTEDGLVVPVIRAADGLGIYELAEETARLSTAAREGKLKPDEIQGASFTVSSLGAIGGTGFTPVVNAPEVAILGVARMATRPIWDGTAFRPRKVLPLSLSYDHRAVNGAEAGRFVVDLAATLGDIRRLVL